MRLYRETIPLLVIVITVLAVCTPQPEATPVAKAHEHVQQSIDSLDNWLQKEWLLLAEQTQDAAILHSSFEKGRKLYKKIEWAVEYFFSNSARQINGPALPEIEAEEHIVIEPGGFQVMEELLYPEVDVTKQEALVRESKKLASILVRLKQLWPGNQFRDDQVMDALRQELYRLITLGISGFDTPVSLTGIEEIPVTLQTVQDIMNCYETEIPSLVEIKLLLNETAKMALQAKSFDDFDRMRFITRYINPLTEKMITWQQQQGIPVLTGIGALRGEAKTLFAKNAFDVNYFTPDAWSHLSQQKIALGKRLFYDPVLSSSNKISCASCHQPGKAFTDGLPKSKALGSEGLLVRNTPSLMNAGFQKSQFYDLRAVYLEDQVRNVVENKDEIHGSLTAAAVKLRKDSSYHRMFRDAFQQVKDSIDERFITIALASYVRSLFSFNSRFDQYMRGIQTAMNSEEIHGFNLFMGKAKCGICHFMPLFNGTVPPMYSTSESEVIGVPAKANGTEIDTDEGRYSIHKIPQFKYAFKTPTVRNSALTAPYMHNGVFKTLDEVIDFYNNGGGNGLGMQLEYQTLPEDSLHLTAAEKTALIAFLHTLNDTTAVKQ